MPYHLEDQIKQWGYQIGFLRIGITNVQPLEEYACYMQWIKRGYHGSMHYLEKHASLRMDPRSLLKTAQSIILCSLPYYTHQNERSEPVDDLSLRFAKYARGKDYHQLMKKRLKRFAQRINHELENPGPIRMFCDTAPIMEKALAVRAGLGWIGKNTLLIQPHIGSYTVLGGLLVSFPLEPDPPANATCGTCTRCVDACPTGALIEPYLLDARKCLSYWNIESNETPPPFIKDRMHPWLFGCDRCQDVCPQNHHAVRSILPGFASLIPDLPSNAEFYETLTEQEFNQFFQGTAQRRKGYRGFVDQVARLRSYRLLNE
jgi:epoxyqueuosine reductase